MSFNHSVSDLVATLKNGYLAKTQTVSMPVSKLRDSILTILKFIYERKVVIGNLIILKLNIGIVISDKVQALT